MMAVRCAVISVFLISVVSQPLMAGRPATVLGGWPSRAGCAKAAGALAGAPVKLEQVISTDGVAADDLAYARKMGLAPRGSAVLTSSGNLASSGITHIIHAATGTMGGGNGDALGEPTLASVKASIANAFKLAAQNGHKRVALPFIGGGIFADRMGVEPPVLAKAIAEAVFESRGNLEVVIPMFPAELRPLMVNALGEVCFDTPEYALQRRYVEVIAGDITNFADHRATAIINAANMEVQFGGGVSFAIARASGQAGAINAEAAKIVRAHNAK